jgi:hypothetical protein
MTTLEDCIIRDLQSARHYGTGDDPENPEHAAFYLRRADLYREELNMPRQSQTQKTEAQPEIVATLSPDAQIRVEAQLDTIKELKLQQDLIKQQMEIEKSVIFEILEDERVPKYESDGLVCKIVRGTSTKLNKLKLFAMGVTQAQLDDATDRKPKKPYLDVRAVGEKHEWEEEAA